MRIRVLSFVLFVLVLFSMPGLAGHTQAEEVKAVAPIAFPAVAADWLRSC